MGWGHGVASGRGVGGAAQGQENVNTPPDRLELRSGPNTYGSDFEILTQAGVCSQV